MKVLAHLSIAFAIAGSASPAAAQFHSLHHHSTIQGSVLSGTAALRVGEGYFLRNAAEADLLWAEAERKQLQLDYEWCEAKRQAKLARLEFGAAKREAIRGRNLQRQADAVTEARSIPAACQSQNWIWPKALQRPEYAGAISHIERILESWPGEGEQVDPRDRQVLAGITKRLRHAVSNDSDRLPHHERERAAEVLRSLQTLAAVSDGQAQALANR